MFYWDMLVGFKVRRRFPLWTLPPKFPDFQTLTLASLGVHCGPLHSGKYPFLRKYVKAFLESMLLG
jgi:hypothetical protein